MHLHGRVHRVPFEHSIPIDTLGYAHYGIPDRHEMKAFSLMFNLPALNVVRAAIDNRCYAMYHQTAFTRPSTSLADPDVRVWLRETNPQHEASLMVG